MKLLIIDNYDSFTYNLVQLVEQAGCAEYVVCKNDQLTIKQVGNYDKILLSPGPGLPKDAGILCDLIKTYFKEKSILGICLGHQAIAEVFGATLKNLDFPTHGIVSDIIVRDSGDYLFSNIPKKFKAGRYHSWVVDAKTLPNCLKVIAETDEKVIMSIKHKKYDVRGVQFHPESVMTPLGHKLIENWLNKR